MKLGIQSYSLRKFPFEEALRISSELGLKYIEAFPGHLPPTLDKVDTIKELERKYGVKVIAHGVNRMPPEKENLENLFRFAKEVGIEVLTADPEPKALPMINELVQEYEVKVAIHNHGPGHRYARFKDVLQAIEKYSELIGMCLDTGHLVRAGDDIVEAAKALGSRLHGVHIKDINEQKEDVIVGQGILDFKEFFRVVKETGVLERAIIILEYELEPDNPVPSIRKSLEYIRSVLGEL